MCSQQLALPTTNNLDIKPLDLNNKLVVSVFCAASKPQNLQQPRKQVTCLCIVCSQKLTLPTTDNLGNKLLDLDNRLLVSVLRPLTTSTPSTSTKFSPFLLPLTTSTSTNLFSGFLQVATSIESTFLRSCGPIKSMSKNLHNNQLGFVLSQQPTKQPNNYPRLYKLFSCFATSTTSTEPSLSPFSVYPQLQHPPLQPNYLRFATSDNLHLHQPFSGFLQLATSTEIYLSPLCVTHKFNTQDPLQ